MYKDTGEFFAVRLPHLDKEWVIKMNDEMGKVQGYGRLEAVFSNFICLSADLTRRFLFKKQKQ